MATVLQIVDSAGAVQFDFNDSTGANNPSGVQTYFGQGGAFELSVPVPESKIFSQTGVPGGSVISYHEPLVRSSFRLRMKGSTYDGLADAVNELARLLRLGGVMKYVPNGSSTTLYIDFEPSPMPALFDGRPMELYNATTLFETFEGVLITFLRQPYLRGTELTAATNIAKNATLILDADGGGRPDDWAWDSTTNISAESIDAATEAYKFTIATGDARYLQQTTAAASVGNSQTWTFSFYIKATGTTGAAQAAFQPLVAAGTDNGSALTGTLTDLTSSWQRLTVSGATPGTLTDKAELQIRIDNDDATSINVWIKNVQFERAASASTFRCGVETVSNNPTGKGRIYPVFIEGSAPAPVTVKMGPWASAAFGKAIIGVLGSEGTVGGGNLTKFANAHTLKAEDAIGAGGTGPRKSLSVSTSASKPAATDYFRQYVVAEKSQSGTDVSVTWERATLTGSLLLLAVIGERISDAHATATVPGAFTSVTSAVGGAGFTSPYFQLWKIENSAARSGTETVTMSGTGYAAQAILMEVDGGNAVASYSQGTSGANTAVSPPMVSTAASQEIELAFVAFDNDITSAVTSETANDYWMHGGLYRHSGAYLGHFLWSKEADGSGVTYAGTGTMSASVMHSMITVLLSLKKYRKNFAKRLRWEVTTNVEPLAGKPFDVYARVNKGGLGSLFGQRVLGDTYGTVQMRWGTGSTGDASFAGKKLSLDMWQDWREIYVGTITLPEGTTSFNLELWSDVKNVDKPDGDVLVGNGYAWDSVTLVPTDAQAVLRPSAIKERHLAYEGQTGSCTVRGTSAVLDSGTDAFETLAKAFGGGYWVIRVRLRPVNVAWATFFSSAWKMKLVSGASAVTEYWYHSPRLTTAGDQWESYRNVFVTGDDRSYSVVFEWLADTGAGSYTNKNGQNGLYIDWWEEEFIPVIATSDVIEYVDGAICLTSAGVGKFAVEVDGPTTLWLKPGLNLLHVSTYGTKEYDDLETSSVTQTTDIAVDYAPRYLT